MERFKVGKFEVPTYSDPPQNYYHESPVWEWKEDLIKTSSPGLGEKPANLIVDHIVSIVKEKLRETKQQ